MVLIQDTLGCVLGFELPRASLCEDRGQRRRHNPGDQHTIGDSEQGIVEHDFESGNTTVPVQKFLTALIGRPFASVGELNGDAVNTRLKIQNPVICECGAQAA